MKAGKIIASTIIIWLLMLAWGTLISQFSLSIYRNYPWLFKLEIISSTPPISSAYAPCFGTLIMAFLFVIAYQIFYRGLPYEGELKGLIFGIPIWMVMIIPGTLISIYSTNLPIKIQLITVITSLGEALLAGLLLGWIYKTLEKYEKGEH